MQPSGMQLDFGYVERCHKNPERWGFRPKASPHFQDGLGWKMGISWEFQYISHPFASSRRFSNWTRRLQICWQKCRRFLFWVAKKASFLSDLWADLGKKQPWMTPESTKAMGFVTSIFMRIWPQIMVGHWSKRGYPALVGGALRNR